MTVLELTCYLRYRFDPETGFRKMGRKFEAIRRGSPTEKLSLVTPRCLGKWRENIARFSTPLAAGLELAVCYMQLACETRVRAQKQVIYKHLIGSRYYKPKFHGGLTAQSFLLTKSKNKKL